jgi:hypothetical protein
MGIEALWAGVQSGVGAGSGALVDADSTIASMKNQLLLFCCEK